MPSPSKTPPSLGLPPARGSRAPSASSRVPSWLLVRPSSCSHHPMSSRGPTHPLGNFLFFLEGTGCPWTGAGHACAHVSAVPPTSRASLWPMIASCCLASQQAWHLVTSDTCGGGPPTSEASTRPVQLFLTLDLWVPSSLVISPITETTRPPRS